MSDNATCGKGLAEKSTLPEGLGAVALAMADVLENHRVSLDLGDGNGRAEDAAFR